MKILVTGAAGFIGFHLIKALLETRVSDSEYCIIGIDNINDYYDVDLKKERLRILGEIASPDTFTFIKLDLADREAMSEIFATHQFDTSLRFKADILY